MMGSSFEPIVTSQDQDLKNRSLGGSSAKKKRFPSYTDIKSFIEYETVHGCGGNLILPDGVSKSAHCPEQDNFSGSPFTIADLFAEKDLSVLVVWFLLH